uniref:Uncharacterized protein n=1 Tax=Panagrolaimus sp. PS1159 TaxID=55785 RepID=A0AC35FG03_9BILA
MVYRDESSGESREISPSTPSSSESISPFSGISKRKILSKPMLSCAICGGKTKCRHFGAVSCNACAAFFRRTIAEKRKYSCLQKENCVLLSNLVRRMCRFCRFKKCVEQGMQEDEVLSLGSSSNNSSTSMLMTTSPPSSNHSFSLTALMPITNNTNYYNNNNINISNNNYEVSKKKQKKQKPLILKFSFSSIPGVSSEILRNLLYCYESVVPNRLSVSPTITLNINKPSVLPKTYYQIGNESKVFWSFYKSSGLSQFIKEQNLEENIKDLAFGWNVLQCLHNTVKFDGVSQNRIYFIDHTYLSISESALSEWYASDPELARDRQCMTRLSAPMWHRIYDACVQLKDAHFSNIEMACFFAFVMTSSIIHKSSNNIETRKLVEPFTNQLFRALSQHYDENYSGDGEMACKIGRIVMMLSVYSEVHNLLSEHRQQLTLCGRKSEYEEVPYTCKT